METRDNSIDVLRCLALTGIIIVHIGPSLFWKQLRSFDVPLMVFLSAVCFSSSNFTSYKAYCVKRFKRLVLPVWLFLTAYFAFKWLFIGSVPETKNVLLCYSLLTGWYLWIVRIFVLMALLAPFIVNGIKIIGKWSGYFLIVGFGLNELLCHISEAYLYRLLVMTFSYALIYATGVCLSKVEHKQVFILVGGGNLLIYGLMALYLWKTTGNYQLTGGFKYPPHLYYIIYAVGVISILWAFRHELVNLLSRFKLLKLVTYMGSHTFWIYLWHIPFVELLQGRYNAPIRFILVYLFAIGVTYLQSKIVTLYCNKFVRNEKIQNDILTVLVG